jgi:hypothetical protein
MSSARPPRGIGSSTFLSSLSAVNRLNGPKENTSLGCESRRSFIDVVRALMSGRSTSDPARFYGARPVLLSFGGIRSRSSRLWISPCDMPAEPQCVL